MIGMSRSWIYDAVQHGKFPAPISLGVRAVAWDAGDVANWQKSRIQKSLRNALKGGL